MHSPDRGKVSRMAKKSKRIKVTPGSQLGKLLDAVENGPVVLESNGGVYRLDRMENGFEDVRAGYDPAAALQGINAGAGSWQDLDPEEVKAFISRTRGEGTRPAD